MIKRPIHSVTKKTKIGINILTELILKTLKLAIDRRKPGYNSRFAKAGVSCFYDSEVLNSSFVQLIEFSAKNPRLRKAAKRYSR